MFHYHTVRLPKHLLSTLKGNQKERKCLTYYLLLKSVNVCGVLKNFGKHTQELADRWEISPKTLRSWIATLAKRGWLTYVEHTVTLRGITYLREELGGVIRSHKLEALTFRSLNLKLAVLAADENLRKQQYVVDQKLLQQTLEGTCVTKLHKTAKSRLLKKVNLPKLRQEALKHFRLKVSSLCPYTINPQVTLSCQGTAKLFGCKSKSSGYYWQQKLKKANLLEVASQEKLFLMDASHEEYRILLAENQWNSKFVFIGSKAFLILPNLLRVR